MKKMIWTKSAHRVLGGVVRFPFRGALSSGHHASSSGSKKLLGNSVGLFLRALAQQPHEASQLGDGQHGGDTVDARFSTTSLG
jgi:hypothetical protein